MEDFVLNIHGSQNLSQIWDKCLERVQGFGFDQLLFAKKRYVQDDRIANHSDLVLFTNYSLELQKYYVESRAYREDIIINRLLSEEGAYSWELTRQAYLRDELNEKAKRVHEQTRALQSKVGYSYGFGPQKSGVAGFGVSILNCEDQSLADEFWLKNSTSIIATLALFDMAVTRYNMNESIDLTEQKLKILSLISEGKQTSDIAELLGLHRRTIEYQLSTIRAALNAETTAEAVFIATSLGVI